MYAEDFCHIICCKDAALAYLFGAAERLLGRLEYQKHVAFQLVEGVHVLSERQDHRHVSVVPAGVHFVFVCGTVAARVRFLDRQSVHVGAERVRFFLSFVEICADAGSAEECESAVQLLEHGKQIFFRFRQVAVKLRYHVQVSPVCFQ